LKIEDGVEGEVEAQNEAAAIHEQMESALAPMREYQAEKMDDLPALMHEHPAEEDVLVLIKRRK
jgi:hypothetical protein